MFMDYPYKKNVVYPQDINIEKYEVIGQDETNVLHIDD